jgi:hypothetical protein
MGMHSALEAGLSAGDVAARAAEAVTASVSRIGDSVKNLPMAVESNCCTSNDYPEKDPNPNL